MAPRTTRPAGATTKVVPRRPPLVPDHLEPLELSGLEDDDDWDEREVRGSALSADAARVTLVRSKVLGVRMAGAHLQRVTLTDVALTDCDLAGAVLDGALVRVAFHRCRLSGADLGGTELTDVTFTDCQLDDLSLRMVRASRLEVRDSTAPRIDLYQAELAGSAWLDTDLTGANLSGATLTQARLRGSTIAELKGGSALRGAVIHPDQVVAVGMALLADSGIVVDDELPG